MAFYLFILVNIVLFVRPSELMPELAEVPIYNIAILSALFAAAPRVISQLQPARLKTQPVTVCLLCLLPIIIISHPLGEIFDAIQAAGFEFLKVILYYLLLIAVVDSRRKLGLFLVWLAVLITGSATLALLDLRGVIDLATVEPVMQGELGSDGSRIWYTRLTSTGIFNDPNDFAMILISGLLILVYMLGDSSQGVLRCLSIIPLAICLWALWETKSRGGLLALVAGATILGYARWNGRRAIIAGAIVLPVVLAGFAARNDGGLEGGTGQQRVQIWDDGLFLFRCHPIIGIGYGTYADECGLVAHNSFIHTYTELGIIGGTLFLGVYVGSLWPLLRIRHDPGVLEDRHDRWLIAIVTALVVAAAVSQFSLSRAYVVPTYMFIGTAAALTNIMPLSAPQRLPQFSAKFLRQIAVASAGFLFVIHFYVRYSLR